MKTVWPEQSGFAAKAKDLQALRDAIDQAATVSGALWLSYIFVFLYLAIAAGAVTHKDLFFENPVKSPFLNVELPLIAFFALGPLLLLIVHAYTLLHFGMLAGKVSAFHTELEATVPLHSSREELRRQLPSNIFVQFLAGPRDAREGVFGAILRLIAWISLIIGPVLLLVFFELQFLPYHDEAVSWWQRIAVLVDLVLLWILWPSIAYGRMAALHWRDFRRAKIASLGLVSFVPILLVVGVATFPGERLEADILAIPFVPSKLLVGGEVDRYTQRPISLWANSLIVPGIDLRDNPKFDNEAKIATRPTTLWLRQRRLENADLEDAYLPGVDLVGAQLQGAILVGSQLQGAALNGAQLQGAVLVNAELQGASLYFAALRGAWLDSAQLQGVSLDYAQLQGASLIAAQLQGASLAGAGLQGADLGGAQLHGALLDKAQLQGASLLGTYLRGASLVEPYAWRAEASLLDATGAYIDNVITEPKYLHNCGSDGKCESSEWSAATYARLRRFIIDKVPADVRQEAALKRISILDPNEKLEPKPDHWADLKNRRPTREEYDKALADMFIETGCKSDLAPYVAAGLAQTVLRRFELHTEGVREGIRVADTFLDAARCPGAQGIPEKDKRGLRFIRDQPLPNSDAPAPPAKAAAQ